MTATRYHAGWVVLLLLTLSLFCTSVKCTALRFGRSYNDITLRCTINTFPLLNANFFVRAPGSSSRQPVQNFTRGQSHEIMFTLTPETEGYFSCQDPSIPNVSVSEELLLAGE